MANIAGRKISFRDHAVEEFIPSAAWSENSRSHFLLIDLPDFNKNEVKIKVDCESKHITVSGQRLMNNNKYKYFEKTFKAPENSEIEKTSEEFEGKILYITLPKKAMVQNEEHIKNEIGNYSVGVPNDKDKVQEKPSGDDIRSSENNEEDKKEEEESKKLGSCVRNEMGNDKESNTNNDKRNDEDNVQQKASGNEIRSSSENNGGDEKKKEERKNGSCVDEFDKQVIKKWGKECSVFEKAMKMVCRNKDILVTALLAFSLGILVSRKFESVR